MGGTIYRLVKTGIAHNEAKQLSLVSDLICALLFWIYFVLGPHLELAGMIK